MSLLELRDLSVCFGNKTVLDRVSLRLEEGCWLMVTGPNGAGKTTLARAIVQSVPYTGTVMLGGRDMRTLTARERALSIGVLSQTHHPEFGFRVEEVVRMGRYAHSRSGLPGRSDPDADEAVRRALEQTGLHDLASRSVLTLSGGEMQRMFFAQVLAQDPRLLILDEPLNHLDPEYQKQLLSLIQEWLREKGRAVISVMHDLSIARAFGDEILLLSGGRTAAYGPAAEVFRRETLLETYHTDVIAWQQELLAGWTNPPKTV